MSAMQRRKGQTGERELFRILSEQLGTVVKRRLGAAREGGCDCLDVPGWAIEVKRTETLLASHWNQAVRQAIETDRKAVLFWRKSRAPWWVLVAPHDIAPELWGPGREPVRMSVQNWCELARGLM